jgi:oxygen-dependent protoporphyrinogen oxidase
VTGYRRSDVAHPLDGFGLLVPAVERRRTLGTLFSSSLFPDRAPEGCVTLTTFVGGARDPELAMAPEAQLAAAVESDHRALLGASASPVFRIICQHARGIPQYNLGHGEHQAALDAIESRNPGLLFAGSHRSGVAVGDVMTSGMLAAEAALRLAPAPAGMTG